MSGCHPPYTIGHATFTGYSQTQAANSCYCVCHIKGPVWSISECSCSCNKPDNKVLHGTLKPCPECNGKGYL